MSQKIIFNVGKENKPQIENIDIVLLQESIFKEQYHYSLKALSKYMNAAAEKSKTDGIEQQIDANNNIFAFIGDRGSGKTSCMMSIAKLLTNCNKKEVLKDNIYDGLKEEMFYALDLIDPSFFDENHNILSVIVAQLYKKYEEEYLKNTSNIDCNKRRELIEQFNITQRNLTYLMNKPEPDDDDLRKLVMLSASVDLKKNIGALVSKFFDCFKKTSTTLLLMVDDIDLNTNEADKMAEQIRKYFIQPNIVVLISLKIDQLGMIKRQLFAKDYSELIKQQDIQKKDLDDMVERYLGKFIPHGQRFYMPDSEYYLDAKLEICGSDKIDEEQKEYPSIKQAVPDLVFKKTRFLFYNTPQHISYIVPRNLRELSQLVCMLYSMTPYWSEENGAKFNSYNKTLLKKYLFENWTRNNVDLKGRDAIDELFKVEEISLFNKKALKTLQSLFPSMFEMKDEKAPTDLELELAYLCNDNNMTYNLSAGDVLSVIDLAERLYLNQDDLHFLFLLRTLYSIRLYEAYDVVTNTYDEKKKKGGEKKEEEKREVMKNDLYAELSEYDKLAGGRYINSRLVELLPKAANERSRSNRLINIEALNKLINECVNNWDEPDYDDFIRMAEFFMLCISRDFSTRNKNESINYYDPSYRSRRDISYAMGFTSSHKNAYFDVNAFFFNVTRIEECYKRFPLGDQFYQKANEDAEQRSFWSKFKFVTMKERQTEILENVRTIDKFNYNKWLSLCSFRNAEIIQDFYNTLEQRRYRDGQDTAVLSSFFTGAGEYSIKTYDRTEEEEDYYSVSFPFAKVVAEWLKMINSKQLETFNSIYSNITETAIVDIDNILKRRNNDKTNLKSTIRKFVTDNYPIYVNDEAHKLILDTVFSELDDKLNKEEIQAVIEKLNSMVENGESKTNIEGSVSGTEASNG